jgi:NAD(P)H-dependent FMN reductase
MSDNKKISLLAISGSLRQASSNTSILRAIALLEPAAETDITLYDGLDDLPHFSPDRDLADVPAAVSGFRKSLREADGVIICTPEYAFGMPGVLKNALDRTVSSGEWDKKPVAAISASPLPSGGEKALGSLLNTLTALSVNITEETILAIPAVYKKLNANGALIDPGTTSKLTHLLSGLLKMISLPLNSQAIV